jgi:hypothetical protein
MSFHSSNTLFTWAEVTPTDFESLPLRAAPTVLLEGIGSLDEHFANITVIFKAEQMAAYFRFLQNRTPVLLQAAPPLLLRLAMV